MKRITILTGAGISAESGLKTFRDKDGLWRGQHCEEIATQEFFGKDPETLHQFYNERRNQLLTVEPNAAHYALVELEKVFQENLTIIAQNVDDLHERAGSINLLHIHGEILKKKCIWCDATSVYREDIEPGHVCDECSRPGGLRPDIVWFGEMPYHMERVGAVLSETDVFLSIGTSGHVYPAANFVNTAALHGAETIEINKEGTKISTNFDRSVVGNATEMVPQIVYELMDSAS